MTLSYRFDAVVFTRRFPSMFDWTIQENTVQRPVVLIEAPDGDAQFTFDAYGNVDGAALTDTAISYLLDSYGPVLDTLGQWNVLRVSRVTYPDGSFTDVLQINRHVFDGAGDDHHMIGFDEVFIHLGGVPLPDFATVEDCAAWIMDQSLWGAADPSAFPGGFVLDWGDYDIDSLIRGTVGSDTLVGTAFNDTILAFGGHDCIAGGAGNDTIDFGAGRDTVDGGSGDDILIAGIDTHSDSLMGGDGFDTVDYRAVTASTAGLVINLAAGTAANATHVGLDRLSGIEGAIGGAGNDTIIGTAADNLLDGAGGVDSLRGGAGDDTYGVDCLADVLIEFAGGGIDTVISSVSGWALGAQFENLTLSGTAQRGTGNALANVMIGNHARNILFGGAGQDTIDGGGGDDQLFGGAGNDLYCVDASTDRVFETTTASSGLDAGGTDTVTSSASFSLDTAPGVRFVENLTLTGLACIDATGNALRNTIIGNDGANVIAGGLGADVLSGGWGADTFVFDTATGAGNVDRITDFNTWEGDVIRFDDAIFTALATGTLAASAFAVNDTGWATGAEIRIVYETDTGRLFYDADGNGAGARVLVATLSVGLTLTSDAFDVV